MFKTLIHHENCSDYVLDALEYIERNLLRVDKGERDTVEKIVIKFEELNGYCVQDTNYCTKRTKAANRTDSGLSRTVKVPDSPTKAMAKEGSTSFRSRGSPSHSRKSSLLGSTGDTMPSAQGERFNPSTVNGESTRQASVSAPEESVGAEVNEPNSGIVADIATDDANDTSTRGRLEIPGDAKVRAPELSEEGEATIGSLRALRSAAVSRPDNASSETQGPEAYLMEMVQPPLTAPESDGSDCVARQIAPNNAQDGVSPDRRSSSDWIQQENDRGNQHEPDRSMTHTPPHQPIPDEIQRTQSPETRHRTRTRRFKDRCRVFGHKFIDSILPPES